MSRGRLLPSRTLMMFPSPCAQSAFYPKWASAHHSTKSLDATWQLRPPRPRCHGMGRCAGGAADRCARNRTRVAHAATAAPRAAGRCATAREPTAKCRARCAHASRRCATPGGARGGGAAESPPAIFDSLVTADQSLAAALQPLADSTGQSSMAAAAADGARIAAAVAGAQSPHLRPPSQPQPPSQPHPPSQQQPTLQLSSQHVAPAAVRPPGLGFSGGIDRIPNCLGGGGFGGGPPPDSSNASSASASPGPLQNSPATLHSFVSRSSATACGGGGLGVSGSGGGTGSATDAKSGMAIVPLSDVPVPSLLHNPRDTPPPLKPLCAFPNYPLLLLELIPCRPGVQCPTISPPFMSLAPPLTLLDDTWQVCCPTKLASPSPPPARGR